MSSFDLNNLLDANLADLADLKKFEALPVGAYRMAINWTYPDHEEFVSVQMALTNMECLEVPGVEEEKLPAVGAKAIFYMTIQRKDGEPMLFKSGEVNTIGQGQLKEVLLALAPAFNPDGTLSNREMIEASEGAEVIVALKTRKDKQDPDIVRNVIKTLVLAE